MSLNEEERKIIVGLEIEKAENIVSQINELEKLSYWDNIANGCIMHCSMQYQHF